MSICMLFCMTVAGLALPVGVCIYSYSQGQCPFIRYCPYCRSKGSSWHFVGHKYTEYKCGGIFSTPN